MRALRRGAAAACAAAAALWLLVDLPRAPGDELRIVVHAAIFAVFGLVDTLAHHDVGRRVLGLNKRMWQRPKPWTPRYSR